MIFPEKNIWNRSKVPAALPVLLALSVVSLTGCSVPGTGSGKMETSTIFAMDTIMEIQVYDDGGIRLDDAGEATGAGEVSSAGQQVLRGAEDRIRTLEKELSVTDSDSEIAKLNATGSAELTEDVAELMEGALDICSETEGALDISIYPALRAWGFTTGEYRVPTDEEIAGLLETVDYRQINVTGTSGGQGSSAGQEAAVTTGVSIAPGMMVDLGSVAKGYTSQVVADYCREQGVTSALINLGGNVQCVGNKPDGKPWRVAIKSPFKDSDGKVYGVLEASDVAIITSGGYERYFEEGGETYWHILDPKTGRPARNGLASVTIIGKDGLMCDGLSTALFVKGLDGAIQYWKDSADSGQDFDMILITEEGEVYVTGGIADSFTLSGEYYNAPLQIVGR